MTKIKHCNGDTYEGVLVQEDEHRVWIRIKTGKVFIIMKADIRAQS